MATIKADLTETEKPRPCKGEYFRVPAVGFPELSGKKLSRGNVPLNWLPESGLVESIPGWKLSGSVYRLLGSLPGHPFLSLLLGNRLANKLADVLWYPAPTLGFRMMQKLLLQNLVTHFIKVPGTAILLIFIK